MTPPLPCLHLDVSRARQIVRRHPRWALAAVVAIALALAGWRLTRPGARFGPQDGTWLRSQINRDLYVGIDPSYPPFAQWTPDGIVGIEADIAREIGRRLGVEPQLLIMGYDSLYDSLYTGYVDLVIAGLRVDPGRENWVHYTSSYFEGGQVLVSPASDPVQRMAGLDGRSVAVELASAGDVAARQWTRRLHALTVTRYLLPDEAMQAVRDGDAAAALVDTVSARQYVAGHPDLVIADEAAVPDPYVIALRKANFRLSEEVERALDAMRADGTLAAIIARWL